MGVHHSTELGKRSLAAELQQYVSAVTQELKSATTPTLISIPNYGAGDEVVMHVAPNLQKNEVVKAVDLSHNALTSTCLSTLMPNCVHLIALDLAGNCLTNCKYIGRFLAENTPLEFLSLYNNQLTDADVVPLANALQLNTRLAVLLLDFNLLTRSSQVMLHKAVHNNKGLVSISLLNNKEPMSKNLQREMEAIWKVNKADLMRRKESAVARQREVAAAIEQEQAVKKEEDEAAARRLEAVEEEARAEERRRQVETEDMELYEATLYRRKHLAATRRTVQEVQQELNRKALVEAYGWRQRLYGTVVREWRDGFTIRRTRLGDPPGTRPSQKNDPPRRLQACWCNAEDSNALYAGTLHYHCKYERAPLPVDSGETKYEGCYATGHRCASVGFYAKPLPDESAAHFFSSPHLFYCDDDEGEQK